MTNDRKKFRRQERDENNRTSWAVGEANRSMITEMAIQYSDSLYQQAELISEPNKKDFLFLDVSYYIEEYNATINEIFDSKYQQYKNSVESVMINSLGNIILEPKSIAEAEPEVVDELINWCEENLESDKIGELFPEIPCLSDGSIIRHSDSFPIRQLQSIQLDDLFKRLEDGGFTTNI